MSLFKRSMSLKAVVSNDQHLQKEHIGPKIDQTSPDETYVLSTTYWSYPFQFYGLVWNGEFIINITAITLSKKASSSKR